MSSQIPSDTAAPRSLFWGSLRGNSLIGWVTLLALGFPGALFAVKYGPRAGVSPWVALAGYLIYFAIHVAAAFVFSKGFARGGAVRVSILAGAGLYVLTLILVYLRVSPDALNIDRWSALRNFWDAFAAGEHPYKTRTHLGSYVSGFPGLFLVALPFWLLGDVGFLQFAALALFVWLAIRIARDGSVTLASLVLLAGLPAFVYEVIVRSDLFSNMVLAAWLLHASLRPGAFAGRRVYLAALLWGLMLSTRGVVIVPLILAAFALLRGRKVSEVVLSGIVLVGTFVATLVPFYLWDPAYFREVNPYFVQSGQIPGWALGVVLVVTAWVGFRRARAEAPVDGFLATGLLLFATVLGCWLLRGMRDGWVATMWEHRFDLSYFVLPMPFLLLAAGRAVFSRTGVPAEGGPVNFRP